MSTQTRLQRLNVIGLILSDDLNQPLHHVLNGLSTRSEHIKQSTTFQFFKMDIPVAANILGTIGAVCFLPLFFGLSTNSVVGVLVYTG